MAQRMTNPKQRMLKSLPIEEGGFTIRLCTRRDLDDLSTWPDYPPAYNGFKFSFASMDQDERDILFQARECQEDKITLIMDHEKDAAIGYVALVEIDWNKHTIGNMGVRLHPAWCDRGVGTFLMFRIVDWCFGNGITSLRLDVAATNHRAVRCYEKVGLIRTGEFWRKDEKLRDVDLNEARYAFLGEHVRVHSDNPEIRFWWMEISNKVRLSN
jgi:RimJ/RimL family protein N-acetyltransferase